MSIFSQILLSVILCTFVLWVCFGYIAISSCYDMVSPYRISKDGFSGYRKSFLERLTDAIELYHKI